MAAMLRWPATFRCPVVGVVLTFSEIGAGENQPECLRRGAANRLLGAQIMTVELLICMHDHDRDFEVVLGGELL
jgi:hypothetical protein